MSWRFPGYELGQPIEWDSLEYRYDWFSDMRGVPQDATWHAEGDVHTHTKMVVDALLSLPEFKQLDDDSKHILFASAMLHDIEKRSTTRSQVVDGVERIVSPKHALKGEFTTRSLLYTGLPCPFHIRERIAKLVRLHGLPLWAMDKSDPQKAVIEASLAVNTKHLAMLARADVLGRICPDTEDLLAKVDIFEELCRENKCWGNSKRFETDYARFWYLNKEDSDPEYTPYDDLEFDVIMMSALPGTGKDTYIKENIDLPMLSLDEIRRENRVDPSDKKRAAEVIRLGRERAKELLRKKQSFVFNATNLTKEVRGKWLSLFIQYRARSKIVYLEVPYKTLVDQNTDREHKVPEEVIHKLIGKLEIPSHREAHSIEYIA